MGSFFFKRRPSEPQIVQQHQQVGQPEESVEQRPERRKLIKAETQPYNPAPIFKKLTQSQIDKIEKSYVLKEFINEENWLIFPEIVEHLRIFNVFDCIEVCNAHTMTVELYHNVANRCTAKLHQQEGQRVKDELSLEKSKKERIIIEQYSEIYASLFNLQFLKLRKLVIRGHKNGNQKESIVSLEVLQYLDSPCLEELHADGHHLTSLKFLKKCGWKRLTTLSLRETKIADSSHFGSILPCLTNSRHIQTLNLESKMSPDWYEVSWLLKMGFVSAEVEQARLDQDDEYYFAYNEKVLRRVEFGIAQKHRLRHKHIGMIQRKFNNSHFDNPLALW